MRLYSLVIHESRSLVYCWVAQQNTTYIIAVCLNPQTLNVMKMFFSTSEVPTVAVLVKAN